MDNSDDIIGKVLNTTKSEKRKHAEQAWFDYLKENLVFPFDAEVLLHSYSEVFEDGDIVKVKDIDNMFDMYGMIMKVKFERKTYYIQLEELDLIDKNSDNFKIINAFFDWSENY